MAFHVWLLHVARFHVIAVVVSASLLSWLSLTDKDTKQPHTLSREGDGSTERSGHLPQDTLEEVDVNLGSDSDACRLASFVNYLAEWRPNKVFSQALPGLGKLRPLVHQRGVRETQVPAHPASEGPTLASPGVLDTFRSGGIRKTGRDLPGDEIREEGGVGVWGTHRAAAPHLEYKSHKLCTTPRSGRRDPRPPMVHEAVGQLLSLIVQRGGRGTSASVLCFS